MSSEEAAYSSNSEVTNHTSSNTTRHTAVLDLSGPGVGVHLRKLQLSLGTGALWEGGVADDVTESLAIGLKPTD